MYSYLTQIARAGAVWHVSFSACVFHAAAFMSCIDGCARSRLSCLVGLWLHSVFHQEWGCALISTSAACSAQLHSTS
jgi:hypothetical protein